MAKKPTIVSLLPAATELACALGLADQLKGISFECDYPANIRHLPRVVKSAIDTHALSPRQIDEAVADRFRNNQSLYVIDEPLLAKLRPDIILTQDLCQVCAPSGNELSQALKLLGDTPQVIFMSPHSLADIEQNLLDLANATGTTARAHELIADWHKSIGKVKTAVTQRRKVFVMEWVEPIYCAGHWLAEMIDIAGGDDPLARKGADSMRIEWKEVQLAQPEIIIVAPCGCNEAQAREQIKLLETLAGWSTLPAVKNNRVYPVDANAYLVRPGPRVINGIEMLAKLFA